MYNWSIHMPARNQHKADNLFPFLTLAFQKYWLGLCTRLVCFPRELEQVYGFTEPGYEPDMNYLNPRCNCE